jgi:alpha-glucosidase (family GH31 glycosyl hydrolase)
VGSAIESTEEAQQVIKFRVYPGANGAFSLYNDDGKTYAYERGEGEVTRLNWDDATGKFFREGMKASTAPDGVVEVIKSKTGD